MLRRRRVGFEMQARSRKLGCLLQCLCFRFFADQHLDAHRGDLVCLHEIAARRIGRVYALRATHGVDVIARPRVLAGAVLVVDLDGHLVLAETNAVAAEQPLRIAASDGSFRIVDVNAVRRSVDYVVAAGAIVDARVAARDVALAVRQYPIAFERAADRAAVAAEFFGGSFAEALPLATGHLQAKGHKVSFLETVQWAISPIHDLRSPEARV